MYKEDTKYCRKINGKYELLDRRGGLADGY